MGSVKCTSLNRSIRKTERDLLNFTLQFLDLTKDCIDLGRVYASFGVYSPRARRSCECRKYSEGICDCREIQLDLPRREPFGQRKVSLPFRVGDWLKVWVNGRRVATAWETGDWDIDLDKGVPEGATIRILWDPY